VITSDGSGYTHTARNINAEYDGYVLGLAASTLFVINLSCCLKYVVDCFGLGTFLWFNVNFILCEAEFTVPDLAYIFYFLNLRMFIKYGLALFAENWVSSCKLT
jgi:hypothetical protein